MSIAYEYNNVFEREKTKDVYTIVHGQMMHLFICKSRPSTESTNIQGGYFIYFFRFDDDDGVGFGSISW